MKEATSYKVASVQKDILNTDSLSQLKYPSANRHRLYQNAPIRSEHVAVGKFSQLWE